MCCDVSNRRVPVAHLAVARAVRERAHESSGHEFALEQTHAAVADLPHQEVRRLRALPEPCEQTATEATCKVQYSCVR